MKTNPCLSVIICTHNRAERLELALAALCSQSLTGANFETVVVDNASTDTTAAVCQNYKDRLSTLRYIYEPVLGLSRARNTGWQQAKSEYIAYLDDDAIPCPVWVESLLHTFETVKPTPDCVGGPIYPLWEVPKPAWASNSMKEFSTLDYGNEYKWCKPHAMPFFGANITYRRDALRGVGGFREELGRKGEKLLSSEEKFLNMTLEQQGKLFYYNPRASVQHWVFKERVDPDWVVGRAYWQGWSDAIVAHVLGQAQSKLRLVGSLKLLKNVLNPQNVLAYMQANPQAQVKSRVRISFCWGYFSQVWSRAAD